MVKIVFGDLVLVQNVTLCIKNNCDLLVSGWSVFSTTYVPSCTWNPYVPCLKFPLALSLHGLILKSWYCQLLYMELTELTYNLTRLIRKTLMI